MRILHLAFEDHDQPASGGGSVRNREMNRRLAQHHDVRVLTAKFAGARDRVEDGVAYHHIGVGRGHYTSLLGYHAALPFALAAETRRFAPHLVVEDFAPPTSSFGVTRWTQRPTCANVQWFWAAEKAVEFRLPAATFDVVQRWATRQHHNFVVSTVDLAQQILAINPSACVDVIPMGADPIPTVGVSAVPGSSVFLGRLDVETKGIDLLLEAFARIPASLAKSLTIAGDGHGGPAVRHLITELGLQDRVHLIGRVDGAAKWRLLAGAQLVVMPSRRETFGIVALEALAAGRPVLACDIPCLREVVTSERGRLVPPGDGVQLAAQWTALLAEPAVCDELGQRGATYAAGMSWDRVAARQEQFYERVVRG
jgi:glycogen(starch) synthase